jgi:hypothetical protein
LLEPASAVDSGFVDEGPAESKPLDEPMPISAAAQHAAREHFNPFDDGSADSDEKPRHQRYFKPKDDYNPFADPAAQLTADSADPGRVFDFGAPDTEAPPPPGELDFTSADPAEHDRRKRRRR